jgi:hypothetical protein
MTRDFLDWSLPVLELAKILSEVAYVKLTLRKNTYVKLRNGITLRYVNLLGVN